MRSFLLISLIAIMPVAAANSAAAVVIRLSDVAGDAGETVEIVATLDAGEELVAGVQNDIIVAPPLSFATRPNGRPDCTVEPSIEKTGTSFAFPPGTCGDEPCEVVRALVLALDNVDPIPDSSVLYRCRLIVDPDAIDDVYPVAVVRAGASDPDGNALPADGLDGSVNVGGPIRPGMATVQIDSGTVRLAETVDIGARILTGSVKNLFLRLEYAPDTPVLTSGPGMEPACFVTGTGLSAGFSFLPPGCAGAECTMVRVELSSHSITLLPNQPLFACRFRPLPVATPGLYAIGCGGAFGTDAGAHAVTVQCSGGTLDVSADPTPTPTPTGSDETPVRATFTATARLQMTTTPAVGGDSDDSCAVVPVDGRTPSSALLWPLVAWWLVRRRRVSLSPGEGDQPQRRGGREVE